MMSVYYKVVNLFPILFFINIAFSGSFLVEIGKISSISLGNTIYFIQKELSLFELYTLFSIFPV